MDFTEKDYSALQTKLVDAAARMRADGWWLGADHPRREETMRLRLIRDVLATLVPIPHPVQSFYTEVMRRKKDDHVASHSDTVNQLFHIISSSVFLGCYVLAFWDLTTAMWAGLAALFLRQFGHAILEPPCHDKEVVLGRVAYLVWAHGPRLALVWLVKLVTDPLTDVIAYSPRFLRPA
jgi:glutamate-1-semialdehyde 2,1-aminomutase